MSLQIQSWENHLLARAQEAIQSHHNTSAAQLHPADSQLLAAAYRHCDQITKHHSKTFFTASALLPHQKRMATRALYAFCRVTDDIVDAQGSAEERKANLYRWRDIVMSAHAPTDNLVALAWADAQARFNIPKGYAEQLIEGVARDLVQNRYETFEDLAGYSYGVASTVGLMAMYIIGFESNEAIPYAVRLGVALQMTNILRDIGEDWRAGRLYLPMQELAQFNLTEADIANHCQDERWQAFLAYQIERTHKLYDESWYGISMLNADGRFAIAAAADLYRAILGEIQHNRGDVFTQRAHVSTWGKIRLLPSIWVRSQRKSH